MKCQKNENTEKMNQFLMKYQKKLLHTIKKNTNENLTNFTNFIKNQNEVSNTKLRQIRPNL